MRVYIEISHMVQIQSHLSHKLYEMITFFLWRPSAEQPTRNQTNAAVDQRRNLFVNCYVEAAINALFSFFMV